jgi:putative endonuclease
MGDDPLRWPPRASAEPKHQPLKGQHLKRHNLQTDDLKSRELKRQDPKRQVAFRTGISAESRAALLLIAKGFRILARRFRSPVGEIDIVARRRALLVFVEVKARPDLEEAAWAVTERQRSRIIAAAEAWLARYPDSRINDIRFDAVLVAPGRVPRHIPAAFDTSR